VGTDRDVGLGTTWTFQDVRAVSAIEGISDVMLFQLAGKGWRQGLGGWRPQEHWAEAFTAAKASLLSTGIWKFLALCDLSHRRLWASWLTRSPRRTRR
jgi:hypothetical protein